MSRSQAATKPSPQQKIFGWVAADRQFGDDEQIGSLTHRSPSHFSDFFCVARQVTDDRIQLCQ